jgi:hypothetical protein
MREIGDHSRIAATAGAVAAVFVGGGVCTAAVGPAAVIAGGNALDALGLESAGRQRLVSIAVARRVCWDIP